MNQHLLMKLWGYASVAISACPPVFLLWTIRIYHDFVQGQGNPPECQRFAVHDKASLWISLSLYEVVVDYFSPKVKVTR